MEPTNELDDLTALTLQVFVIELVLAFGSFANVNDEVAPIFRRVSRKAPFFLVPSFIDQPILRLLVADAVVV